MRLSKIKLAGFKSFVDPTTVPFPSNLTGVVGPNGCGKSNIIDAVRWVMGESSAKNLRGDSMADVIFNGSTSRKPVGVANIELTFDNSDGSYGGQYANFAEISIKRQVSRDGQSQYFLNNSRCRRRDITDIFLGTGLGPRSYAIIEQGTISRLIEAKPDELRVFLEEAAGISRYKERRRETANRIRSTRDNLDRLSDLRGELEKQLTHLQRQAKSAERYSELKREERQQQGELQALRWQQLDNEASGQQQQLNASELAIEATTAQQRHGESLLEQLRLQQGEATEHFNTIQTDFYSVGAEISRLQQAIHHARERLQAQQRELAQIDSSVSAADQHRRHDSQRRTQIIATLSDLVPEYQLANERAEESGELLAAVEEAVDQMQQRWDEFSQQAAIPSQQAQIERARMQQLEQTDQQQQRRLERLQQEMASLETARLEEEIAALAIALERVDEARQLQEDQLSHSRAAIGELRAQIQQSATLVNRDTGRMQQLRGRYASLEVLQQAALGQGKAAQKGRSGSVSDWLQQQGLTSAPRLGQQLQVSDGWELAVETLLGDRLQAVVMQQLELNAITLAALSEGQLTLIAAGEPAAAAADTLLAKVTSTVDLAPLLSGVLLADSLTQALQQHQSLTPQQSFITREGIMVGRNWLRLQRGDARQAGVLQREQELKNLLAEQESLQQTLALAEAAQQEQQQALQEAEEQAGVVNRHLNQLNAELNQLKSQLQGKEMRREQIQQRQERLQHDEQELLRERQQGAVQMESARSTLHAALAKVEAFTLQKEQLQDERQALQNRQQQSRQAAREAQQQAHNLQLRLQTLTTERDSLVQAEARSLAQLEALQQRREALQQAISQADAPLAEQQQQLQATLAQRLEVEGRLATARQGLGDIDHAIRAQEGERLELERQLEQMRQASEQQRMHYQELYVRRQTLAERLQESGLELQQLLDALATCQPPPTLEAWQAAVEQTTQRITRLGPINLAAIAEYQEQLTRKNYLDAQNEDLVQALATLEEAIAKIDKETRNRFKETFDKVNSGLQEKFPLLFGGGHAYLELTGSDLLDTGVGVMARPPGKRNSTIHLLSGGEKALTAVALVFAIFELNPSPFCMLDEVDAPLDEANVGRFCNLVREMASQVQFIFITHNKTTMELASSLIGVTMQEPGVSRMVAVDVDAAIELAAVG
ncbi:MAG: chromosome segregation protein SMC [Gammaproteobacteria bacterium]|nr:chromosome segregation protein SMC [Gammaproteobacteria bacterium]